MSGMLFYSLLQYHQLSGTPSPGCPKDSITISAIKLLKYKWRVNQKDFFSENLLDSFTHIYMDSFPHIIL